MVVWGATVRDVMLVKLIPAESITTDVTRMTLEIGVGNVVLLVPSFSDGLSEEGVGNGPLAASGTVVEDASGLASAVMAVLGDGEFGASTVPALTELAGGGGNLCAPEGCSLPFGPIEPITVPSGNGKKSLDVWQHPTSGRFVSQQ